VEKEAGEKEDYKRRMSKGNRLSRRRRRSRRRSR